MDEDDSRFISGIHTYCDRWCERCRFTNRCRVYAEEQKRLERHLLRGEDPDDPEVFMEDMHETFGTAMEMLQQMAEEAGVDLDAEPPPRRPKKEKEPHPLRERTERWSDRVGKLLARVRTDLPAIGEALARRGDELSDREQDETLRTLEGLRDAYEVLLQYRFFIPVKTVRATDNEDAEEDRDDHELAKLHLNDALGTAKLVHECLGKAAAALWRVGEFSRDWQDDALPLAAETESLRQAIDAAFPGHQEFRRPGLDDPPDIP